MTQKLEGLILQGYKTFASKTSFAFPDQITVIVGPNGSGKSNIADSIRWVLGEQAYSLLRGKKTEDMIYSGSSQRSKMSMASATIRFNNEDTWLPIDFNSVSITRRAYRSGENEYLINDKKVRLRDIQELLANSGLAERTYTVIGQGLVDSALSLKPQDRRIFFEEAAGIGLFRSRREAATRKLDHTMSNMDRARDILHEIQPRMRKLEKQVDKAREYNRIIADLQVLLKDWYGYRWNLLKKDYRNNLELKNSKEKEFNSIKDKISQNDGILTEKRNQLQVNREKFSTLNTELTLLQSKKEVINRDLAIIEERFKGFQDQKDSLNASLLYAEEDVNNRQLQLEEIKVDHQSLEKNLENASKDLENVELQRSKILARINDSKQNLNQLEKEIIEIEKKIAGSKAQHNDVNDRMNILINRRNELETSIKSDEVKQKEFQDILQSKQKSFHQKETELLEEKKLFDEHISNRNLFEKEKQNSDFQLIQLQNERNGKNTQLEILENAKKNLEGFRSGTKQILSKIHKRKLQGSFEPLLSYFKVKPGYEKAISAILGDKAEGIVLDKNINLSGILELLENPDNSHSILIPSAMFKNTKVKNINIPLGCIDAMQVIESKDSYQHVFKSLFNGFYILDEKRKLKELLNNVDIDVQIVTKDGCIFYGNGIISIGGTTSEGFFKREQEILDIRNEIRTIEKRIQEIEIGQRKKDKEIEDIEQQILRRKDEIINNENIINEAVLEINSLKEKQEEVNHQIRINNELIQKFNSDIESSLNFKKNLEQKLEDFENTSKGLSIKLAELKNEFSVLSAEEIDQDFFEKKTEFAVAGRTYESSQKRFSGYVSLIDETSKQRDELKNKLVDLENHHKESQIRYEELKQLEEKIKVDIDNLQLKITPLEQEISVLNSGIDLIFSHGEEYRKSQSIIERHFIQLEMRVDRAKSEMNNLKERIADDFGIVSYEYGPEISGLTPLPIDGMVDSLPKITEISEDLEQEIKSHKSKMRRLGSVNPEAEQEYQEVSERFKFLSDQLTDLEKAEKDLRDIVRELEDIIKDKFKTTFKAVNQEFSEIFTRLFGGGTAKLIIDNEENITETGIEIEATLPGKRKQELALLSGGERSLTAIALIFSLLKISPTPFCFLDEVDAMLDESNVVRLGHLMKELSDNTQFIIITHNRNTVQIANVIYGVTMGRDSTSQVIGLNLDEVTEDLVE